MSEHPSSLDRKDALIALLTGLASLALYVRTLVPALIPGDSAEFQTLAYAYGHAHTTGYEVITLLAHLFVRLVPVGDIAYRVNLQSAFYGGLTVALVYLAGRVISRSRLAGLVSAFVLAISTTFWSQAIIAEVVTPGSAFTAGILLLVLLWYFDGSRRCLFAAGLLGGLAIGVHNSNSLFAPAIGLLILLGRPGLGWLASLRRAALPALGGALAGLALMLAAFLIVDANQSLASTIHAVYQPSASDWDLKPAALDSVAGRFTYLIFARQWRSAMFADPEHVVPDNFDTFNKYFPRDYPWMFQALMALGVIGLFVPRWGSRWRLVIFLAAAVAVHAWYSLNYRIGDIYVFYPSLYVYLSLPLAEGVGVLMRGLGRLPSWSPRLAQPALALILLGLAVSPVYTQRVEALKAGEIHFDFMGLRSNQELEQWRKIIAYNVKALPKNALVLTDWNNLYGYYYVAQVEQGRTDLQFVETYPYVGDHGGGMADSLLQLMSERLKNGRPVIMLQLFDEVQRGGFTFRSQLVGFSNMFLVDFP